MPQIVQYGLASIGALWLLYMAVRVWHDWVVASAIVRQDKQELAIVAAKYDSRAGNLTADEIEHYSKGRWD